MKITERSHNQEEKTFGAHPDTSKDYNFEDDVAWLPFKFNNGDHLLPENQQYQLLDSIWDHKQVFSLHDEDLGFCSKLTHTIQTTTDKPVYLHHGSMLWQLQREVRKCLDIWNRQGVIRPSKSSYNFQVVIVHKKTGEILLSIDYWKLHSIVVKDAFPPPCIDEALQAVYNCQLHISQTRKVV